MKNYIAFGWDGQFVPVNDLPPVDKMYGTTSDISYHEQPAVAQENSDDGYQYYGLTLINKRVQMPDNMFQGKNFLMKVLVSYDHINGPENGTALVAYYEIPRSGF